MTKPEAVKKIEEIEKDIEKHREIVRLRTTLDQVQSEKAEHYEAYIELGEQERKITIELNELTGKVVK